MDRLISQGMHSFSQGDHARMHALWSGTTVFSHLDNEAIASLLASIQATAESGQGSEWSWLMLCLVYLDSSDQDRKSTRQNSSHNTLSRMPSSA